MQTMTRSTLLTAALVASFAAPTFAAAQEPARCDLPRGKDVYQMCSACHSLTAAEPTREGPSLAGIIGRKAASQPGFQYSAGMKAAGWEWTAGLLDSFIASPRKAVRNTTMTFNGLRDAADRAAVVCYIVQETAAK
jgi:cytochrome c